MRLCCLALLLAIGCERKGDTIPPTTGGTVPEVESAPPPDPPEPAPVVLPDVEALRAAATAAAHKAQVEVAPFAPGPRVGTPQKGRRRMPWTAVLYKGIDPEAKPYLVDKSTTYFERLPRASIASNGKLTLQWRTRTAAPRAIVYLGLRVEADPIAGPRFRNYASETTKRATRDHQLTVDARALLNPRFDVSGVIERGFGEIVWQVEQFVPEVGTTVIYDGRTAFRIEGGRLIQQPTVLVGPLVHLLDGAGFVVSFETDVPTAGAVAVGDRLPRVSAQAGTRHEIKVDGLEPGTRYAYQVSVSNGAEASVAPAREVQTRGEAGPVVVAIMSDSRAGHGPGLVNHSGVNALTLQTLLTDAYNRDAEAIFFPGDLINGYTTHPDDYDFQLRAWLRLVSGVGGSRPIYTGMGNHEAVMDQWSDGLALARSDAASAEARFAALMTNPGGAPPPEAETAPAYDETVYAVDIGGVHFVMLNTNYWVTNEPGHERLGGAGNREGVLMDGQLQWLEKDLAAARKSGVDHIVVLGHEPAFPAGGHTKDAMWYRGALPEVNAMRERFWEILAKHRVLAYVSGDEHNYSRALIGNETVKGAARSVYSVITGGCGAPYYALDPPDAYADRIQAFSPEQHYTLWTFEDGEPPRLQVVGISGDTIEDVELTEAGG